MASFACKKKAACFRKSCLFIRKRKKKISVRDDVVYPLWNDGAVIFKYEPLDVMGPETLLFYSLGLDQQALALVIYINKDAPDTIHPCISFSPSI